MNIIPADTFKGSQRLWKVLKTNHDEELANRVIHELFDNNNYGIFEDENIDITHEFETYRVERANAGNYKITQMTLPQRFGVKKTQTNNVNPKTPLELESPQNEVADEQAIAEKDPNHKVRSIF